MTKNEFDQAVGDILTETYNRYAGRMKRWAAGAPPPSMNEVREIAHGAVQAILPKLREFPPESHLEIACRALETAIQLGLISIDLMTLGEPEARKRRNPTSQN